ncbi:hypothetical protein [Hydrogenophaga sp. NFH-34]|nr:hypothetical protein [Hydrogenophaga sp. NFH-34]
MTERPHRGSRLLYTVKLANTASTMEGVPGNLAAPHEIGDQVGVTLLRA